MGEPAVMNWSGGKDSALALHAIQSKGSDNIKTLFTTLNREAHRISMHGVRKELLEQQAASIGLPLKLAFLPREADMETYNEIMVGVLAGFRKSGITKAVFGDIFLEDLREYRENQLSKAGFSASFPLWKKDTRLLIDQFLQLGFKTIVTCVNTKFLPESFAGRIIDRQFLEDLPDGVDPCGEHGEFHTFVFDGPIFSSPVSFRTGKKVIKSYRNNQDQNGSNDFCYCDLIPD